MKIVLISEVASIAILVLFQSFTIMPVTQTEEQNYTRIHKDKNLEIRFYLFTNIARVNSDTKSYKEFSRPGFWQPEGYILGRNEAETKIPMTAPVHKDVNDTVSTMSFVMPLDYTELNLPKPNDPNVILQKKADEYVATIHLGGFASDSGLKFYSEKLQKLMKDKGITYEHSMFLG